MKIEELFNPSLKIAALTKEETLISVGATGVSVVKPPTYAPKKEKKGEEKNPPRYSADVVAGKLRVVVDSIQSQGNRLEPLFMDHFPGLVPQVVVSATGADGAETPSAEVNLLRIPHRLCDASVRFSSDAGYVKTILKQAQSGNLTGVGKLNPTALIFGFWDSRGSGAKVKRMLSSEVVAYDCYSLTRASQYTPPLPYANLAILGEEGSKEGFSDVPDFKEGLGGVEVHGKLELKSILSYTQLRLLKGATQEETEALRQYLLGLSLVLFFAADESLYHMRSGCSLVPTSSRVFVDSAAGRQEVEFSYETDFPRVLDFAKRAAESFGVGENRNLSLSKESIKEAEPKASKGKPGKGKKDKEEDLDIAEESKA
jgi:CRISPR-associated protein Csb1